MKKIGIFVKNEKKVKKQAIIFEKWLNKKNEVKAYLIQNNQISKKITKFLIKDLFCIFVLGGDGTFLSAVRWMKKYQKPIIGVKFGEIGFLSEISEENLYFVSNLILRNKFNIQPRIRLTIEIIREGKKIFEESILNDVVINKGALARLARIRTYINNKFLTDYRADGLIIATPTGSTAYSLAAGGPIVYPSLNGILITPICPFTLTNRPLILPDKVEIAIKLTENSSDIVLTFDGQIGVQIDQRDKIIIKKSSFPVTIITLSNQDYFKILKTKLKWSGSNYKTTDLKKSK